MNKKAKHLWYLTAIACLILFVIILVACVLDIGEKLRNIDKWVEYGFYVLVVLLVFFGIINPIRIIVTSPSFDAEISDNSSRKNRKTYRLVARNIAKNNVLTDEEKNMLTSYKSYDELQLNLQIIFEQKIRPELNKIMIQKAKTVLISTAICQNARVDMITVFSVDINMVKDLVVKCGFRPNMKNLSKLLVKIFGTALIAEGLQNLTMEDILPQSTNNALKEIPFIKPVMSSVTQGLANALLTLRIGCVARRYLFKDGTCITREDIRRNAFKDALLLYPQVLVGTLAFIPKKIVHLFTPKPKDDNEVNKNIKLIESEA
ncbi:MAG: YcjF family protein [Acholeplasmatales bacterium]|nr:YcjF family protein [Acholeplasmatales bacterium]